MSHTVLMLGRPGWSTVSGGDRLHAEEVGAILVRRGHAVVFADSAAEALSREADTLWCFSIQRSPDWIDAVEAFDGPTLLTPLWHDTAAYHRSLLPARLRGPAGALDPMLLPSLRWGSLSALRETGRRALARMTVLPGDDGERVEIEAAYEVAIPRTIVVPPAVPLRTGIGGPARDIALCVGRIEPLKRPLASLRAGERAGIPMEFIGAASPHRDYVRRFRKAAGPRWMGERPYAETRNRLADCRVHISLSWTESFGRAAVEAALCGAAIVAPACGVLSRAFAGLDGAFFVEPGDDDVVTVLRAAWDRGRVVPSKLVDAARVFTWEHVESALIAAFEGARA